VRYATTGIHLKWKKTGLSAFPEIILDRIFASDIGFQLQMFFLRSHSLLLTSIGALEYKEAAKLG
jgi:hypothetical protein